MQCLVKTDKREIPWGVPLGWNAMHARTMSMKRLWLGGVLVETNCGSFYFTTGSKLHAALHQTMVSPSGLKIK
jgi:hypothetical protein